jgi:hypothetical protein
MARLMSRSSKQVKSRGNPFAGCCLPSARAGEKNHWRANGLPSLFTCFFVKLVPRDNGPRPGLQPRQPGP